MNTDKIKVFISYTWDNEKHMEWVLRLAKKLEEDMLINVVLDRERMYAGGNLNHFADKHINEADKIIVIFTKEYKVKAVNRRDAAGYEYSIINTIISRNIAAQQKVIPVLKKGSVDASIPEFMQAFLHIDFRNPGQFVSKYKELQYAIGKENGNTIVPLPAIPWYVNKRKYLAIAAMLGFALVIIATSYYRTVFPLLTKKDDVKNATFITPKGDSRQVSPKDSIKHRESVRINPGYPASTAVNKHNYSDVNASCCTLVKGEGKFGFVDSKGRDINGASTVQFKYSSAEEFNEGLAKVGNNSRYGFIDKHGNAVIPMQYEAAESFSDGKANVRKNGHWYYIDKNNNCVKDCPPPDM
ncbi:TIR domain-containing protein [Taibaiella lutea]|uniref:TIR domain-containing protein n=1 Tax=Taibaiella lutea TaxID=2608001 RepID=A0A5M6CIS5_9BACT|nr:WG repeat-containing protein [Taibaiella lutea]KAA5535101.1 TIR domain-containing protein [Taibaiella lutea]